jgi:hypothetical protein
MKQRYIWLLAALLLLVAPLATQAQDTDDDEDVPEIGAWRGGNLAFGFRMGFDMMGTSIGSGSIGGLISPAMNSGAASLTRNPAELGLRGSRMQIIWDGSLAPGTRMSSGGRTTLMDELNNTIRDETAAILDDPDQVNFIPGGFRSYTNVYAADVNLGPRFPAFAVSVPFHERFVAAVSTHTPINMALNMNLTGFQAKLAQEQGSDDVSIRFDILMNIGMVADFSLNMHAVNAGFGGLILDDPEYGTLTAGFTSSWYSVTNRRMLDADLSGMVVVSGADERFFNNPNDQNLNLAAGETNSLYMRANGLYRDSGTGYTFGLYYQAPIRPRLGLSLVYTSYPEFNMSDPNSFADAFLPVFVEGNDLFNDDIDVDLSNLEASKPNLTTRRDMGSIMDDMVLRIPNRFTLGLDLGLGPHNLVFNYTAYSGELSLNFGDKSSIGKTAGHGFGFGADFKMKDRLQGAGYALIPIRLLFLDFDGILMQALRPYTGYTNPRYRFGFSVMTGTEIATGEFKDMDDVLAMPLLTGFAMGRTYRVFNVADVGFTVFGFPDLLFKFSLGLSI